MPRKVASQNNYFSFDLSPAHIISFSSEAYFWQARRDRQHRHHRTRRHIVSFSSEAHFWQTR